MTSRVPWKAGAAVLALLLSASLPSPSLAGEGDLRPLLSAGEKAPGFSLRDVDGNEVHFPPGDGRPALVVFWSVFCPMCRELMPGIGDFAVRHGAAVRVIGVNLDGSRFAGSVRDYLREMALPFPVGLDALRGDLFIASDPFGVEKTPTAVLVDGGGTVRGAWAAEKVREFLSEADSIVAALQKGASPGK
ncbi:MAG TPA: TlpA disulfide reductase family protein [Candidatus Deferrimicrobiaceae bacterium]